MRARHPRVQNAASRLGINLETAFSAVWDVESQTAVYSFFGDSGEVVKRSLTIEPCDEPPTCPTCDGRGYLA